jgi:hypothetical protein
LCGATVAACVDTAPAVAVIAVAVMAINATAAP